MGRLGRRGSTPPVTTSGTQSSLTYTRLPFVSQGASDVGRLRLLMYRH